MMAATAEKVFKIVDLTKVPSAEPGRTGLYDVIVTYQDSAGRVRVVTLPSEEFSEKPEEEQMQLIKQAIEREEGTRLKFIGKEITL